MKRFIFAWIGLVCYVFWFLGWGIFLVDTRPWDFFKVFACIMSFFGGFLFLVVGTIFWSFVFPPKKE